MYRVTGEGINEDHQTLMEAISCMSNEIARHAIAVLERGDDDELDNWRPHVSRMATLYQRAADGARVIDEPVVFDLPGETTIVLSREV